MAVKIPFHISLNDNLQSQTKEIHFTFTEEFKAMSQEQRVKTYKGYIEHLIAQAQLAKDDEGQKGIITVLQIAEQMFPHLQSEQIPLDQTIIVEIGENAEGEPLDELLKK